MLAAEMRAGELQLLADEVGQMLARVHAPADERAVDRGLDLELEGGAQYGLGSGMGLMKEWHSRSEVARL